VPARRPAPQLLLGALLVGAIVSLTVAADASVGLLHLAPALLLLFPLLCGRYVGRRALAGPRRATPRHATSLPQTARARPARRLLPRGSALIAAALAVRPPPPATSLAA
jgi:hypothetical protein